MADFVVVDTDILIDASRTADEALACLQQVEDRSALAVSAVTEMELVVGCRDKAELRALDRFLHDSSSNLSHAVSTDGACFTSGRPTK